MAVVIAAIVGYCAWNSWQDKKRAEAADVSQRYDSLVKLINVEAGKTLSDADRTTAEHIATEIKANHSKSMYATSSAFFLAKLAVDAGDLDKAANELQWVIDANVDVATNQLAHVRLARVLIAKGAYDDALAQISEEPSKAFNAEYAEVRGDILKAQGNKEAALTAYEQAIANTDTQQQERLMLLQMKADDLKLPVAPTMENAQ